MPDSVVLDSVCKNFGSIRALDRVSLKVCQGEVVAIVGPSGSGKTTLLRCICALERPDSGKVWLWGKQVQGRPDSDLGLRRKVAMILQKPVVFRGSVLHNVGIGLAFRGVARSSIVRRGRSVLDRMGLLDRAGDDARELSGGEVQRLAFARTLVLEPELLLLDEFTANLDPANVTMLEEAVRIYGTGSRSVVVVTHNPAQAKRMSDRVCLLVDGRVAEVTPTAEFFSNPATEVGRRFLSGDMVW